MPESKIRLNKYLSQNGLCSRRSADKLILAGKVRVNGVKVTELGLKVDEDKDIVELDGKSLKKEDKVVYYALNKPVGYITTVKDPKSRKKVIDLVPEYPKDYPVGRLDYDSEGLIILTNDGDFTYRMTHPKFEKEKEYEVKVKTANRKPQYLVSNIEYLNLLKKGVKLKEGLARADNIRMLKEENDYFIFSIVLHQGWNRQIRRMCATVGLDVLKLKRVRIGKLKIGNIKTGEYKKIDKKEIESI